MYKSILGGNEKKNRREEAPHYHVDKNRREIAPIKTNEKISDHQSFYENDGIKTEEITEESEKRRI